MSMCIITRAQIQRLEYCMLGSRSCGPPHLGKGKGSTFAYSGAWLENLALVGLSRQCYDQARFEGLFTLRYRH